jgi:hypothetical protein
MRRFLPLLPRSTLFFPPKTPMAELMLFDCFCSFDASLFNADGMFKLLALKDWILADTGAPTRLQEAVRRLDEQGTILPLMLCCGVANGSKHLRQGRDPKRRAKTVGEIEVDISTKGNSKTTYTYKVVDDDGNSHEAIELAQQALKERETIIRNNTPLGVGP